MYALFDDIIEDYLTLETSMGEPSILENPDKLREVSMLYAHRTPLIKCIRKLKSAASTVLEIQELMLGANSFEQTYLETELFSITNTINQLEQELHMLILPIDTNNGKNVIVEIRGAEGGEDANLFARDLFDMYIKFSQNNKWNTNVLSIKKSNLGGISQVIFVIKGHDVWEQMCFEGGTHRVQRVSATEKQGRVHTSTATVIVLAEAAETELLIDEKDLRVDVYRASGHGGQGVNTTDSAVRITHIPTGLVVAIQDERSQLRNKISAMRVLRSRLLKLKKEEARTSQAQMREAQVGRGGRSEKIRTYNVKENRITDHRIEFTIFQLEKVLNGELSLVIDPLIAQNRSKQFSEIAAN